MQKDSFFKKVTATKLIEFDDGEKLEIEFAKIKRPYRQTKEWLGMFKESQSLVKSQGELKKKIAVRKGELDGAEDEDRKAGLQTQIDSLETDLQTLNQQIKDYTAPFADYLIPDDESPRRVLLGWDLMDGEIAVPCNREQLEDLPDEVIVFIAGELLSDGDVGEEKPAR